MSIPKINSIGVWVNPNEAAELWAAQGLQQTRDMAQHGHEAAVARDKNTKVTIPLKPQTISSKKEDAIKLLEQLTAAGYDLGKIDGIIGRKTNAALARAKADGYVWENGKLIKPKQESTQETPRTPITGLGRIPGLAGIDYGVTALGLMYALANENKERYTLNDVPVEQLQKVYQNGPGFGNAAAGMIYHIVAPEAMSMPHTNGLKNQIAAAIAYNESLPESKREKDSTGISVDEDGYLYVGYNTYGKLTGQSGNVNDQGTKGNAASKVIGGLRYKFNEDGSVDVKDAYGFNVVRDFSKLNNKSRPAVIKDKTKDQYMGKPLRGLIHDLRQEHSNLFSGQGLQDLAENYGTRQGKVRNNSLQFDSGEIESRINR